MKLLGLPVVKVADSRCQVPPAAAAPVQFRPIASLCHKDRQTEAIWCSE